MAEETSMTATKNRIKKPISDYPSTNGNGKHVVERSESEYAATPEGMTEALQDLVPTRQALRIMKIELNAEQTELRRVILKYSEKNIMSGEVRAIQITLRKITELRGLMELAIQQELIVADERFDTRVAEIKAEDGQAYSLIKEDVERLRSEFRDSNRKCRYMDSVIEKVVPAYAAVNDLLEQTLTMIRDERERLRVEQLRGSARNLLSEL